MGTAASNRPVADGSTSGQVGRDPPPSPPHTNRQSSRRRPIHARARAMADTARRDSERPGSTPSYKGAALGAAHVGRADTTSVSVLSTRVCLPHLLGQAYLNRRGRGTGWASGAVWADSDSSVEACVGRTGRRHRQELSGHHPGVFSYFCHFRPRCFGTFLQTTTWITPAVHHPTARILRSFRPFWLGAGGQDGVVTVASSCAR